MYIYYSLIINENCIHCDDLWWSQFHYLRNLGKCWISAQNREILTLLFPFLLGAMKLEDTKFRPREVVRHVLQTAAASLKKELILEGHVADNVPVEVGVQIVNTFCIHGMYLFQFFPAVQGERLSQNYSTHLLCRNLLLSETAKEWQLNSLSWTPKMM